MLMNIFKKETSAQGEPSKMKLLKRHRKSLN
jgi:hypothetical protein